MEIIFMIGLAIQFLIGCAARREEGEKIFLFKSAQFLYRKIFRIYLGKGSTHIKNNKNIGSLNPGKDYAQLTMRYYVDKIRLSYSLVLAGNILALLISLCISQNGRLIDEIVVPKNNWSQGNYALDLSVTAEDSNHKPQEITIVIEPISLTEEEATILAQEVFLKLRTIILEKNQDLSHITEPLNLVTKLSDYPFIISWHSDKASLVKSNGRINNHEMESNEGEIVKLTAHLLYQDEWVEYQFSDEIFVRLMPYFIAVNEWEEAITAAILINQKEKKFSDSFTLPEKVSGIAVRWQEVKVLDSLYLWLMAIVAAVIAFAGQDQDLQKKVTLRNRQIDRDYPELVRKLALYLGAGMTLRGAWKRITLDHFQGKDQIVGNDRRKTKYLYEEMRYSVRELENGIPEREVYENFGKRVGIAKYRKLMGLLCNHLQKGNKNLLQVLREEMELALEDRKKAARAIGEEMSTKLLLPMMMMLLIVMVIIMVPAFQMF